MSRLLARIMLALLMLPLAAVIYTVVVALLMEAVLRRSQDEIAFLLADVVTAAFVGLYWMLLWRGTVRWTPRRVRLTAGALAVAVIAGVLAGVVVIVVDGTFALFVGGMVTILLWLVMTILLWQETRDERARRVQGTAAVICPRCGYNLTGLRQTTCPECGARFTLDELLGAQPGHETVEIAR